MAATAKLLEFLAGGFAGAEDGTVEFFAPGTTDPVIVFRDAEALDPYEAEPLTLGGSGQLTVYVTNRVRAIIRNTDGVAVFDQEPTVTQDRFMDSASDSFEGQSTPMTAAEILRLPLASFGGTNFRYLAFPGETEMNLKDWMSGVHVDVRAFGAVGDDARDNLDNFLRAVDFCADRGGGVVHVPAGTWRTRDTWQVSRDGVEIQGVGRGQTIIKCMGAAEGMEISGSFVTLRAINLQASVTFNAGFGLVTTGEEVRILNSNVFNWDGGINIAKAGVVTILDDVIVFHGEGIGIALTGVDTVGRATGSALGVGRTEITSCQLAGQNIVSGDDVTSPAGISITGTTENIVITGNYIDKPDYGVVILSGYTGKNVLIEDNSIGAMVAFGAIRCDVTASTNIRQSGNGADRILKIISGTGSHTPNWLSNGLLHKIATDASGTVTINAPTPTPTEFGTGNPAFHVHPELTLHLSVGGGVTTSYTWNAIYVRGTALASLAAGHDYIIKFQWDREQLKWIETGVDVP